MTVNEESTNTIGQPTGEQSLCEVVLNQHAINFFHEVNDPILGFFSSLSKSFYHNNKELLKKRLANKLLNCVVRGEREKAFKMIALNPDLLLIEGRAQDYSGRIVISTAFQAAIGAGDKPMYTMMLSFLSSEEALKQFNLQFPKGIVVGSVETLKGRYQTLYEAIRNDRTQQGYETAIAAFRDYLTTKKIIKAGDGFHFNLQEMVAALQVFVENYDHLDYDQCILYCVQIIGFIQRQLTAYDAKVFCSGIQCVLENESAFKDDVSLIFPLVSGDGPSLGFDFYINGFFRECCEYQAPAGFAGAEGENLTDFIELKQMNLLSLENRLREECTLSSIKVMGSTIG